MESSGALAQSPGEGLVSRQQEETLADSSGGCQEPYGSPQALEDTLKDT